MQRFREGNFLKKMNPLWPGGGIIMLLLPPSYEFHWHQGTPIFTTQTSGELFPFFPGCVNLYTDIAMPIFYQVHPSQELYYSASCTHYLILFCWILGRQDFDARLTRTFHLKKYIKTITSRLEKNSSGVKTNIGFSEVEETKEAAE